MKALMSGQEGKSGNKRWKEDKVKRISRVLLEFMGTRDESLEPI
jgi:hypothetical protein